MYRYDAREGEILAMKGEILLSLVTKIADREQWRQWLRAPLEHALAKGKFDIAKELTKAGADPGPGWAGVEGRPLLLAAVKATKGLWR